jgi:hypothetical protein
VSVLLLNTFNERRGCNFIERSSVIARSSDLFKEWLVQVEGNPKDLCGILKGGKNA